jgi:hypothetical protein
MCKGLTIFVWYLYTLGIYVHTRVLRCLSKVKACYKLIKPMQSYIMYYYKHVYTTKEIYMHITYIRIYVLTTHIYCILKEDGHSFSINGKSCQFRGTIAVVSADNLASCALGGFKEGSTAHRGCRHCMATPDEISSKVSNNYEDILSVNTITVYYIYTISHSSPRKKWNWGRWMSTEPNAAFWRTITVGLTSLKSMA